MNNIVQKSHKTLKQQLMSTTVASLLLISGAVTAAPVVFSTSGANAADIQGTVDDFRDFLGDLNSNIVGSFPFGRREIDWDRIDDLQADPNEFPPNFFNDPVNGSPRGVVLFTPGSKLLVSANSNNPTNTEVEFGDIKPRFPRQFATFSPERLFSANDNNVVEVHFFEPGTTHSATVSGFGAVFTDVDRHNSTKIEYFDREGKLLASQSAKPGPVRRESLSFVGVGFDAGEKVNFVRITSGDRTLTGKHSGKDHVAMDDFVFGEPQPILTLAPFPP